MNLDRYEKLDGFEHALRLMREGKTVTAQVPDDATFNAGLLQDYKFNDEGVLKFEDKNVLIVEYEGAFSRSTLSFNKLNERLWYIKKPFDVRQAMLDRPNEWVGAFKNGSGRWNKLGFDERRFVALYCDYGLDRELRYTETNVYMVTQEQLDICIPIEDVPEEVTL